MSGILLAFAAFRAAGDYYVFFPVGFVKESGYQMAVFKGNFFVAHGAFTFFSRFRDRVAVGASAYGAKLVRNIHRAVNTAYQILAWQQIGIA